MLVETCRVLCDRNVSKEAGKEVIYRERKRKDEIWGLTTRTWLSRRIQSGGSLLNAPQY